MSPTTPIPTPDDAPYDVLIVGGSFAGLSAAMSLGRSLRRVLVVDDGKPANRFAPEAHNVLTHDGTPPHEILAAGRRDLAAYPTVEFAETLVTSVSGESGAFQAQLENGQIVHARKVIFGTGLRDLLPELPGYAECWGKSIIHCPYCHGYEYAHQPTGILASGDAALHLVGLIRNWTNRLTLFTDGAPDPLVGEAARPNVSVVTDGVVGFRQNNGHLQAVTLANGRTVEVTALYHNPPFEQSSRSPASLGCAFTEAGHLRVDGMQKTSTAGVYAAGDCTTPMRSVVNAMATGTMAGAMVNHELIAEGVLAAGR